MELRGKTAVVTGASSGIGAATVRRLRDAGVLVAGGARRAGRIDADVAVELDVTDETSSRAFVDAAVEALGGIDILFNNAGIIGAVGALAEYDEDAFDRIMAINVRGVFLGLRHVLPIMIAQGSGAVINTGSLSSERGLPGTPAYNAAKHAVLGLTRSAASEVAPAGVRVNAVLPGMIDTPMLAEVTSGFEDADAARRAAEGVSPQGRLGQAEEIAAVVAFLASDAASLVNGVGWAVDGGILGTLPTAKPA